MGLKEFDFGELTQEEYLKSNGLSPRDAFIPSEEERKRDQRRLLIMLSQNNNPDTGKNYTAKELSEIFSYDPRTVQKFLREAGYYSQPRPEVRYDELPENEKSFFIGLGLGDFQVGKSHWGSEGFITVATQSPKERKRQVLQKTLGTWGEVRDSSDKLRVYVSSPTFNFMEEPPVTPRFLDAKSRYAPFLLGMMTARLTERDSRISLHNDRMLGMIHTKFEGHFGFRMGNFRIDERQSPSGVDTLPVIEVRHPGEVLAALVEVPTVSTLPFFRDLAKLG